MKFYNAVYTSITQAVGAMADRSKLSGWRYASRDNRAYRDWDDNLGYDGAKAVLATGWAEGANKIRLLAESFATSETDFTEYAPAFIPAESGAFGFAQAALAGDPECFYQYDVTPIDRPVIRLAASTGIMGTTGHGSVIKRAAGFLAVINMLERSGVRVELWAVAGNHDEDSNICFFNAVRVKEADQSVDLNRLAFLFGHGAAHRRLMFSLIEKMAIEQFKGFSQDYGASLRGDFMSHGRKAVKAQLGDDVHLLPCFATEKDLSGDTADFVQACVRDLAQHGIISQHDADTLLAA